MLIRVKLRYAFRPVRRTIMLVRAAFISVVSMRAVLMRMFVIVAVLVMVFE
jgi:hypothetical protein